MNACPQCGLPVFWRQENGKWLCRNPDGSDHWDACSQARFERIKAEGEFFAGPLEEGYKTRRKKSGVQFTRLTAKDEAIGERYKPDGCDCGLPPWELCREDCPHAIKLKSGQAP